MHLDWKLLVITRVANVFIIYYFESYEKYHNYQQYNHDLKRSVKGDAYVFFATPVASCKFVTGYNCNCSAKICSCQQQQKILTSKSYKPPHFLVATHQPKIPTCNSCKPLHLLVALLYGPKCLAINIPDITKNECYWTRISR